MTSSWETSTNHPDPVAKEQEIAKLDKRIGRNLYAATKTQVLLPLTLVSCHARVARVQVFIIDSIIYLHIQPYALPLKNTCT